MNRLFPSVVLATIILSFIGSVYSYRQSVRFRSSIVTRGKAAVSVQFAMPIDDPDPSSSIWGSGSASHTPPVPSSTPKNHPWMKQLMGSLLGMAVSLDLHTSDSHVSAISPVLAAETQQTTVVTPSPTPITSTNEAATTSNSKSSNLKAALTQYQQTLQQQTPPAATPANNPPSNTKRTTTTTKATTTATNTPKVTPKVTPKPAPKVASTVSKPTTAAVAKPAISTTTKTTTTTTADSKKVAGKSKASPTTAASTTAAANMEVKRVKYVEEIALEAAQNSLNADQRRLQLLTASLPQQQKALTATTQTLQKLDREIAQLEKQVQQMEKNTIKNNNNKNAKTTKSATNKKTTNANNNYNYNAGGLTSKSNELVALRVTNSYAVTNTNNNIDAKNNNNDYVNGPKKAPSPSALLQAKVDERSRLLTQQRILSQSITKDTNEKNTILPDRIKKDQKFLAEKSLACQRKLKDVEIQSTQQTLANEKKVLDTLQRDKVAKLKRLNQFSGSFKDLQSKLQASVTQEKTLQTQETTSQTTIADLKKKIASEEAKVLTLQQQEKEVLRIRSVTEKELKTMQNEVAAKQASVKETETAIAQVTKQVDALSGKLQKLQQKK